MLDTPTRALALPSDLSALATRPAAPDPAAAPREAHPSTRGSAFFRRPATVRGAVFGLLVPAIVATLALPANAQGAAPVDAATAREIATAEYVRDAVEARPQSYVVDAAAAAPTVAARDGFTVTSAEAMAAARRAASYVAPLTDPPAQPYSGGSVVAIAQQYLGVPYVFGGSSPAGFDCSGFTRYVFAQVGVALPHGSASQGSLTRIAASAAVPGDLVILDGGGHVGIYLGGNMMIDAPYEGRVVSIDDIYDGGAWFVRPGI